MTTPGITALVLVIGVLVLSAGLAFASWRRHSRAARARSQAALRVLLAEDDAAPPDGQA